jgi:uncharacterized protein YkwD
MAQSKLEAAAMRHARAMAQQEKLITKGAAGLNPFNEARRAGYRFAKAAEEVASGPTTPDEVIQDWLDHPSHKKNLLGTFTQVGVGYATAEDGTPYWCVLFAIPMDD